MEIKKKKTGPKTKHKADKINTEELRKLAAMQCTTEEIALWFNVSKDTIERNFMHYLEEGRAKGRVAIKRALFNKAQGGDNSAMIWWTKNFCGMTDKIEQKSEITGSGFTIEFAQDDQKKG